jgi:hypothetical protein
MSSIYGVVLYQILGKCSTIPASRKRAFFFHSWNGEDDESDYLRIHSEVLEYLIQEGYLKPIGTKNNLASGPYKLNRPLVELQEKIIELLQVEYL